MTSIWISTLRINRSSTSLRHRTRFTGSDFQSLSFRINQGSRFNHSSRIHNRSETPESRKWIYIGLGTTCSLAFTSLIVMKNESRSNLKEQDEKGLEDPLDQLRADVLLSRIDHLSSKSTSELLRSYLTFLMCEIPALVDYGPKVLESYMTACEAIPLIGPLGWWVAATIMRQTFFAHYTGGETAEACLPVLQSLHHQAVGTLMNYSAEAPRPSSAHPLQAGVSQPHIDANLAAVSVASQFESSSTQSPIGSAPIRPTTVAIKLSGLVSDPYVFERASSYLSDHQISPYQPTGELFPTSSKSNDDGRPSLSKEDRRTMESLLTELRGICRQAKESNVIVMIDAEYSWFQPAIDRLATFLASEFNRFDESQNSNQTTWPTVYNTFQALLRSTPDRIQEAIEWADSNGFSIGIKLVRGAYLVAESHHWPSDQIPVWSEKSQTDECFDRILSSLTHRLSNEIKQSNLTSKDRKLKTRIGLMIAGHNVESAIKVLKQLRDQEGLGSNLMENGVHKLALNDALRGRMMFAQLYGMADQFTHALSEILISPNPIHQDYNLPPFVQKCLPFGSLSETIPYLARRAQENKSVLHGSGNGEVGRATLERRVVGEELRRRFLKVFGLV
ncbi:FAD-linked oxidoreductase-like protein [Melampsora americana]|nr:FAD-linked oxidoreductase-like protein [Melampsora americana]